MKDFIKSPHFKIMTAIVVFLFLLMFFVSVLGIWSSPQSSILGAIFTPIQKSATWVGNGIHDVFSVWGDRNKLQKENEELKEEVNKLREQLVDYESVKQENILYRDFLGIKEKEPDMQFVPAKLIAKVSDTNSKTFSIDKGSVNGISIHDPVITGDGVVGYISKVALTYSTVTTLLDIDMNISAVDSRTRKDMGILKGSLKLSDEGKCELTMLPENTGAEVGDLIVTTGYGGVFPKDLILGKITSISLSNTDISKTALVEPTVDISNVSDVLVITYFDGQGSKIDEKEAEAKKAEEE